MYTECPRRRQDDSTLPTPGVNNARAVSRRRPWCGPFLEIRAKLRRQLCRVWRLGCLGGNLINRDRRLEDNGARLRGHW
eukprot:3691144-Pyramimonas_sp.AAC.1